MNAREPVGLAYDFDSSTPYVLCNDGTVFFWFQAENHWGELPPVPGTLADPLRDFSGTIATQTQEVEIPGLDPADQPAAARFFDQTHKTPHRQKTPRRLVVDCYRYNQGSGNPAFVCRVDAAEFDLDETRKEHGGGRWSFRLKDNKGKFVASRNVEIEPAEAAQEEKEGEQDKTTLPHLVSYAGQGDRVAFTAEAVQILRITDHAVRALTDRNNLPCTFTPGGNRRFRLHDLIFLANKYPDGFPQGMLTPVKKDKKGA